MLASVLLQHLSLQLSLLAMIDLWNYSYPDDMPADVLAYVIDVGLVDRIDFVHVLTEAFTRGSQTITALKMHLDANYPL